MYYNQNNIMNIDFSKYKRFIAFGCSFTRWRWASWSDCLRQEMPDAAYVNTAQPGAGNPYISIMLNRMCRKYMFDEETLIGICWSTFYRDDTFDLQMPGKGIGWVTPGNIYSTPYWPEEYIKLRDPYYFTMRDCATIAQTVDWLKHQRFDSFTMMGMSIAEQNTIGEIPIDFRENEVEIEEIIKYNNLMYDDLKKQLGPLYNYTGNQKFPDSHGIYPINNEGDTFHDYHPKAEEYWKWMEHCRIPVTEKSQGYALFADNEFVQSQESFGWRNPEWDWPERIDPNDAKTLWEAYL